ncbi:MAG: hypothetical protein AAF447_06320 [Myxococcota bacterium]
MRHAALLIFLALTVAPRVEAQGPDPRDVAAEVHAERGYADHLDVQRADGSVVAFPPASGGASGTDAEDEGARPRPDGSADGIEGRIEGRSERIDAQMPGPDVDLGGFGRWIAELLDVLARVLLVAVVLGLLAFLVFLVVRFARPSKEPPADPGPAPEEPHPDTFALPEDLGDPDELAAAGRFDEAVVALLVRALKHVGWEPGSQRGLTAREVVYGLADARRGPLMEIVRGAERVRFAGDRADEASYGRIRRWYDALVGSAQAEVAP